MNGGAGTGKRARPSCPDVQRSDGVWRPAKRELLRLALELWLLCTLRFKGGPGKGGLWVKRDAREWQGGAAALGAEPRKGDRELSRTRRCRWCEHTRDEKPHWFMCTNSVYY